MTLQQAREHVGRYVWYLLVSTTKQGAEGYGVDAQRAQIEAFLNGGEWERVGEYVEVESGRKDDRPQLAAALDHCRRAKATLIVAKLDRLSRDVRMLLGLIDSGVPVRFVDLPDVSDDAMGRFVLTMMVALAELESRRTGERTRAALAQAKRRGVPLGRMGSVNIAATVAARKAKADADALRVRDFLVNAGALTAKPKYSQRELCRQLNAVSIPAPRGGQWRMSTLQRVVARLKAMEPPPARRGRGRPRKTEQERISNALQAGIARAWGAKPRGKN